MKKNDYLQALRRLLEAKQVPDMMEIMAEYEQHFAFKQADGFSEEEIAARLGSPEQIAAQYEGAPSSSGCRAPMPVVVGLGFCDLFAAMVYILLIAAGVVLGVGAIAFLMLGACLVVGTNPFSLLPAIPYWCGAAIGFSCLALAVLMGAGCVYYAALLRQLLRSFVRFQKNMLAVSTGRPALPPLPLRACLPPSVSRKLRSAALISLLAFAALFVLSYLACALSAGSLQFWHTWGWFGYQGA